MKMQWLEVFVAGVPVPEEDATPGGEDEGVAHAGVVVHQPHGQREAEEGVEGPQQEHVRVHVHPAVH